jgi:hypothetical protein
MPTNTQPYEIIAAPFEIYLAPLGTTFPVIEAAPSASWSLLGTNGSLNYDEGGVTVTHVQTLNKVYTLGATGPRKAFREREGITLEFSLVDLSLEQYAKMLNNASVVTTAAGGGFAGNRRMDLLQGPTVVSLALLCRGGASPYGDGYNAQYEVPQVFIDDSPSPVYQKGKPAMLKCRFEAIQHPSLGFGTLRMQDSLPA